MTNPHDPTSWQNVNLVALSPRGREVAARYALAESEAEYRANCRRGLLRIGMILSASIAVHAAWIVATLNLIR